jgi:hypothetical protein
VCWDAPAGNRFAVIVNLKLTPARGSLVRGIHLNRHERQEFQEGLLGALAVFGVLSGSKIFLAG